MEEPDFSEREIKIEALDFERKMSDRCYHEAYNIFYKRPSVVSELKIRDFIDHYETFKDHLSEKEATTFYRYGMRMLEETSLIDIKKVTELAKDISARFEKADAELGIKT